MTFFDLQALSDKIRTRYKCFEFYELIIFNCGFPTELTETRKPRKITISSTRSDKYFKSKIMNRAWRVTLNQAYSPFK